MALALPALMMIGFGSCKSYLDKSPDSDVSSDEAFGNFRNFQGFVEDQYRNVPIWTTSNWQISWNYGEDEILSTSGNSPYVTYNFDQGDFRAYFNNWGGGFTHMYGANTDHNSDDRFLHHILNDAWYCIRKANIGLHNFDHLTDATDDQKNAIKGQLYFWRAWWHAEMLYYMGGIPYIDRVVSSTEVLTDPRLSVQETALRCAEDFGEAAKYLPEDWDRSDAGSITLGHNELRVTKATALGYQGKLLLWAASPLAEHGAQTGGAASLTYQYNTKYAEEAAKVLGDCIDLIESGNTPYELASYDFKDIYNHEPNDGVDNIYSEIFWTQGKNWLQPGGKEAMLRGNRGGANGARWGEATVWGPNVDKLCEGGFCIHPTANYVDYAYGMANGEPIYIIKDGDYVLNTSSGFDEKHPFKNRDPRFYHDIVYDGCKLINAHTDEWAYQKFAALFTGGLHRDVALASRTGYLCQKLFPHTCNKVDDAFGYGKAGQSYLPWMRVAEIYLMYAEAGAAISGSSYKAGATSHTAEGAINVIRDRVGAGHVAAQFTGDQKAFMDEVRRERACELSFEGRRMPDLMRWLLITEKPYTIKKSIEFTRKDDKYDYDTKAPEDAEVVGFKYNTILERSYTAKHYFWPWQDKHVYLYEDFPQNPGW